MFVAFVNRKKINESNPCRPRNEPPLKRKWTDPENIRRPMLKRVSPQKYRYTQWFSATKLLSQTTGLISYSCASKLNVFYRNLSMVKFCQLLPYLNRWFWSPSYCDKGGVLLSVDIYLKSGTKLQCACFYDSNWNDIQRAFINPIT